MPKPRDESNNANQPMDQLLMIKHDEYDRIIQVVEALRGSRQTRIYDADGTLLFEIPFGAAGELKPPVG